MDDGIARCSKCGQHARPHPSGQCHDCRRAAFERAQRKTRRPVARIYPDERTARLVYDYDRDF